MREVKATAFVITIAVTSLFFGDSSMSLAEDGLLIISIKKPLWSLFSILLMPFGLMQIFKKQKTHE